MIKHTLNSLLSEYFGYICLPNYIVSGLKIDSRLVIKGDLFIAIKGYYKDGKDFIFDAIFNGAVAILTYSYDNKSFFFFNNFYNVYFFYLFNLDKYLSDISSKFYNFPSKNMFIIGVTGTNGKTTVLNFFAQWLYLLGEKVSILSTIGNGLYPNLYSSLNTTCSALDIQFNLNKYYLLGCKFVGLEVSSHSLIQNRVKSLYFSSAIFTNLTLDHLDYHKNMFLYEKAKWKLFSEFNINNLIINIDDPIGLKWSNFLSKNIVITVSLNKKNFNYLSNRWLYVKKIIYFGFLKKIYFCSSWGNGILCTLLIGIFNIKNLLLSFVSLLSLGFNINRLINISKYLLLPKGRMEFFYSYKKPLFIVDYAHTPDALKKVLIEARNFCKNKLWCIFGCTGNRDRKKRSIMGKISKKFSDFVVITNDDVYFEDENNIIEDIKSGIDDLSNVYVILNRTFAIRFCFENANYNDVILLAGKGHENYQIFCNKKIKYSDRKFVSNLLGIF